jgi:hypothetical protein
MSFIDFTPRWREELVATSAEGKLIFELTMGEMHVYFPGEERWQVSVPDWAKEKWQHYLDACRNWCRQNNIPISIMENALVYEEKK